jgi:hypothetical protein
MPEAVNPAEESPASAEAVLGLDGDSAPAALTRLTDAQIARLAEHGCRRDTCGGGG